MPGIVFVSMHRRAEDDTGAHQRNKQCQDIDRLYAVISNYAPTNDGTVDRAGGKQEEHRKQRNGNVVEDDVSSPYRLLRVYRGNEARPCKTFCNL